MCVLACHVSRKKYHIGHWPAAEAYRVDVGKGNPYGRSLVLRPMSVTATIPVTSGEYGRDAIISAESSHFWPLERESGRLLPVHAWFSGEATEQRPVQWHKE